MGRVALQDDGWEPPGQGGSALSAPAWLSDDPPVAQEAARPTLRVRQNTYLGDDDDGNSKFRWVTIVEGPAADWEERAGSDPVAGTTLITAGATIAYGGSAEDVSESAVVVNLDTGRRYAVKKRYTTTPGYLRFDLTSSEQR